MATTDQLPTEVSAQHHASKFSAGQKRIAMITISMAFIMDLLDNTIVNIAIPSIQTNLGASYATIQWLVAGYALSFALLLITGGRMGDVFGYKKLFLGGVAGFTVASLLCGLAWSPLVLIIARLLQGAMAALMVPQVMSVMQIMFEPHERGPLMGMFGAMAGVAATLGPIVGGILIHFNIFGLDWRPIFLINIPVGVIAFVMGLKYLPDGKSPHPLKLDLVGTGLVVLAMGLLVFPLIQGRELGWPAWSFVMMAAAIPFLLAFGWWQKVKDKKDGSPLIVPALVRIRSFVLGLTVNIVFEAAMISFFLPFTLILQIGLGFEVIKAALTGIPTAIGISVTMAVFAQKLMPKLGRYTMTIGTVVMSAGFVTLYAFLKHNGLDTTPWQFIPGLLLVGAGMALVMSPMFSIVLNDVDSKHAGSASGVLNALQQLGGAIGTAVIGVIFFGHLTANAPASFSTTAEPIIRHELVAADMPVALQDHIIDSARTCYIDHTNQKDQNDEPASCKSFTNSKSAGSITLTDQPGSPTLGQLLQSASKKAVAANFIDAFRVAMLFELGIMALVFALSFTLPRHIRPEEELMAETV